MNPKCPLCFKKASLKHIVQSYRYYFCNSCTTLFLNPIPPSKTIHDYYQKDFSYSAGIVNEKLIRTRSQIILNKLMRLNPQGSKLLDIGSGYGFFLDEAQKKGLKITGIEPSKELIKHTVTATPIINDRLPTNKLRNKKFDFITLVHIIEHVKNPKEIIRQALLLLNPQGILYIETPNIDSHLYRYEKENYTFLTPPDHLWIFSQYSLEKIIPKRYQILKISTYSYPEHFMGTLKALVNKNKTNRQIDRLIINKDKLNSKQKVNPIKLFKYIIFDLVLARLCYRILNIHQHGSILELYIKKK